MCIVHVQNLFVGGFFTGREFGFQAIVVVYIFVYTRFQWKLCRQKAQLWRTQIPQPQSSTISWILWASQPNSVGSYWFGGLRHSWLRICACSCDVQLLTNSLWLPWRSPTIWEGGRDRAQHTHAGRTREHHLLQDIGHKNHRDVRMPTAPPCDTSVSRTIRSYPQLNPQPLNSPSYSQPETCPAQRSSPAGSLVHVLDAHRSLNISQISSSKPWVIVCARSFCLTDYTFVHYHTFYIMMETPKKALCSWNWQKKRILPTFTGI